MILDVEHRVAAMVAQGMALEQVVAAGPAADYEGSWGDPARFLAGVYAGVGGDEAPSGPRVDVRNSAARALA